MGNQGIRDISVSARVHLIPIDRLLQSFLPRHFFFPTKLVQLGRVDGVTQVIEGAIGNVFDPLFFLAVQSKDFEQSLGNHKVGDFVVSTNIVNVARFSFVPVFESKIRKLS